MVRRIVSTGWAWVPSLYYAQGLPYAFVMTVSVVMYKTLGISNTDIALYTSWLYLPWVIKPLWSPLVELFGTKRRWILAMQLLVGAALALVALTLPMARFFQMSLAMLWLAAFSSATHDIAADGFYMLALDRHRQAAFVGVRSAFWRLAAITGQGGLVYLAGELASLTGDTAFAWSIVLSVVGALFVVLFAWHWLALPRPASDRAVERHADLAREFVATFADFFRRENIGRVLAFLLLFRFAEAQALKLVPPFLLDPVASGGLGLTTSEVGIAYGTFGVIALTAGGILGGLAIARDGLDRWLWPMAFAMHVPNLVFVYLAAAQPAQFALVCALVAIEQFGYGFGFAAYLMFMILVAKGSRQTAHYAIATGFMALGMMVPGMWSGWLQEQLGYARFFVWVCVATLPSFLAVALVRIPAGFGTKASSPDNATS
jgi:MFS transporter, PAT family, beta-lactamase induction signal transducer AmpG